MNNPETEENAEYKQELEARLKSEINEYWSKADEISNLTLKQAELYGQQRSIRERMAEIESEYARLFGPTALRAIKRSLNYPDAPVPRHQ